MFDLIDELKDRFEIDGVSYQFDLSFDTIINFYELLEDKLLRAWEKIEQAFELLYADEPHTFTYAQKQMVVEQITDYIQKSPYGGNYEQSGTTDYNTDKGYSYTKDAGAIYSSFLADYGIDLLKERGKMHYITFKSLLAGLSEGTHFQRILSIRSRSITGLEGEELSSLLELQEYYSLESENKAKTLNDQMGDMFSMLVQASK